MLRKKENGNSNTCAQVQLHAIVQAQGRCNSFPRIWLYDLKTWMQFKSKKDWTRDNSCPCQVRSKYYVVEMTFNIKIHHKYDRIVR